MESNTKYYIVSGKVVAKRVFGTEIKDYYFDDGKWEETEWRKDNPEDHDSVSFEGEDLCELGDEVKEDK